MTDATRGGSVDPEARRRAFVSRGLAGFVATMPLFMGVGVLQGGRRMEIVLLASILGLFVGGGALALVRRRRLAAGVHLLTFGACGVLGTTMTLAQRTGNALWVFLLVATFASVHSERRRMLVDFAVVGLSSTFLMATLPPLDLSQHPTFSVVLLIVMVFGYFHAQVTEANYADIHASNDALHALTTELEGARRVAESANDAKSAFLTTISHELRTPLNAVLGYTALVSQSIEDDDFHPDEALADLARVEQAGRRLADQVSRILDITRLEVDDGPAWSEVELRCLLEHVAEPYRAVAEEKGLTFEVGLGLPRTVRTDPSRLERLVANLLDNAVRFTDSGRIALTATTRDGREVVAVEDTGVGIDAATLEKMFEPFTQADQSTTRTVGGTGLGLYLVRRLGETMQAELDIRSEPGEGTTVELVLPRAS